MPGVRWAAAPGGTRGYGGWLAFVGYFATACLVLVATRGMLARAGSSGVAVALVGILLGILYTIISFRYLSVPFFVWILSVCGFRFLWNIQAPGLPDLYLDRLSLIWLSVVFLVKSVAERRALRGPFRLDGFVLLHGLYLLAQVVIQEMTYFSTWTASVLLPYAGFFLAKNIIVKKQHLHSLMWVVLALSIYYNVTSVAEKYDLNWLIWPKYILTAGGEFAGRSQGPFLQAPLFGTVIGMLLPVHLYCLAAVKGRMVRTLLTISLAVGLAGLYFTYTRGSWLAGLAALGTTVAMNRRVYLRFLTPVLVLAPVVAVGFLGLAQDKFMKERVENEDTIGSRMGTAVTVARVWRDHPVFGVGFFQYRNVREKYIQPVEIPGLPVIRFQQFRHNSIHDIYLGPLAEEGLVGTAMQAAIYVLIFVALIRKFFGRARDDPFTARILPILGGIMIGYLVGGIAFDYRFFSVVGAIFMVCAGITDGYVAETVASRPTSGPEPARSA